MATKYPNREELFELFSNIKTGNYEAFFDRVSDDVDWQIMGQCDLDRTAIVLDRLTRPGTSPMSKIYKSKAQFRQETLGWLAKILEAPGLRIHVHNIIGGGDCEWMTAEMKAKAMCKNGEGV